MTDDTPAPAGDPATAGRMRAVAAALTAAGLEAHLHQTRGVLDITASLHRDGRKPVQVIADEDGYVQVSYWNDPAATPAQVVATITRALAVITGLS